jgi:hypothetical protein
MLVVNTIAVAVRGVPEPATIVAIRQTVQTTLSHLVGAWHVRVSASAERGRWDLHIRGGFGHHIATFLAAPDRLAECVERRLRAFLHGIVPPLSAAPRRPVLVSSVARVERMPVRFRPPPPVQRDLYRAS